MDLLEHRARLLRLLFAVVFGGVAGVGVVFGFAQVLDRDSSGGPMWFIAFTFVLTLVLVSTGTYAFLTARARRRWHLPIPTARVVRR
jgi:hypothetical protein